MPNENKLTGAELKIKVKQWTQNIESLKLRAERVKPHAKPEYDRLLDLLVVKLSLLNESVRTLKNRKEPNKRTESIIQKTLHEMEQAFISAMSKMK